MVCTSLLRSDCLSSDSLGNTIDAFAVLSAFHDFKCAGDAKGALQGGMHVLKLSRECPGNCRGLAESIL